MKALKLFTPVAAAFVLLASLYNSAQAADEVMRVGTDATFPPMEFVQDGKRTGFDVELIEAIGKQLNKKVEWVDIGFKGLIPGLISNRFDVAASAIYMTEERQKVVNFTDSFCEHGNNPVRDVFVGGRQVVFDGQHAMQAQALKAYRATLADLLEQTA